MASKLEDLIQAARELDRENLEDVEVHVCDFAKIEVRRQRLYGAKRKLSDAIAAYDEQPEWKPIETAPKDGSPVWIKGFDDSSIPACWANGVWFGPGGWIEKAKEWRCREL